MSQPWAQAAIASIVEGDGEVRALPRLLHRIAADLAVPLLTSKPPMRIPRSRLVAPQGVERAVTAKGREVAGAGGILVLLDADDDCPAQLGPQLRDRARAARADKRIAVVLANREFEAWFLAAMPSLAGQCGLPAGLSPVPDPEVPRDCKGRLTKARGPGHPYKETVDQPALAAVFDIKMAQASSPSFGKFCRDVAWLLGAAER